MDVHRCRFVPYPASSINAVAFSRPNDKGIPTPAPALRLAIGRANGDIEIWNPYRGCWVQDVVFAGGDKRSIDGLTWASDPDETGPDGKIILGQLRLFSIGSTPAVTEWDLSTGQPVRTSTGNFSDVWCFAAQPRWRAIDQHAVVQSNPGDVWRGQDLVAGCGDGTLVILSTEDNDLTFKRFLARPTSRKARCMSVTWQNRHTVVAGFADSMIRVYDARNGALLRNMSLGAGVPGAPRDTLVWRVKSLPDGTIVSGDSNGEVRFWDGKTHSLTHRVTGHDSDCLDLVVSSDGQTVFSGGMDGKIATYQLRGREGERRRWTRVSYRRMHEGDIKSMAVYDSKTMSVVVSGGVDTTPVVTPLREHNKEHHRRLPGLPQMPPVASAPGQRLLVSWWDRNVCIWRISKQPTDASTPFPEKNRKLVARITIKGTEHISSAVISPDGAVLAVSTTSSTKVFQLRPPHGTSEDRLRIRQLEAPSELEKTGGRLICLSPDSHWLSIISPENEIHIARIAPSLSSPDKLEILPSISELQRPERRHMYQSGLRKLERTSVRMAFSSDSAVLVVGDLAGYLDSWVLEGRFDPTAPAVDTAANSQDASDRVVADTLGPNDASDDESSSSDSDEDETIIFYGQHWSSHTSAPSNGSQHQGTYLPKLDSPPLILSFRPSPTIKDAVTGNPGVHPTRHNPHAHSHVTQATDARCIVVTAQHQVYEFDVLAGKLTDWSRRNPTSVLPTDFRAVKDRAVGLVWDPRGRAWLYGVSWVGMLDVTRDFDPTRSIPMPAAVDKMVEYDGTTSGKKRKRETETERWARETEERKRAKGHSGAGDKVKNPEHRTGVPSSVKRITDTRVMELDLDTKRQSMELDADADADVFEQDFAPLRRADTNDEEMGDAEAAGEEEKKKGRRWWMTYKYRPILGMVPIGKSEGEEAEEDKDGHSPLEVVLVERPIWELKQVRELKER